jgi:cholesterol transport system auxiliary component
MIIRYVMNNLTSVLRVLLRCGVVATTLWVTGCAGLLPSGPPPDLYNLTPKSTFPTGLPKVAWQLVIEEPLASGGLDASQIALRPSPIELKYFAGARWTERAPKMVQTLLIESFENTDSIIAVGRQAIGLRSDYNLRTELREFQAEYFSDSNPPSIRVRINAKLITQPRQIILASRSFEFVVDATGSDLASIIEAFDDALGKVIKGLVEWTLEVGIDAAVVK